MRVVNRKEHIDTPALLLDLDKLEFNLTKAADYFKTVDADLRPHIKTHKCPRLARMQIQAGAIGITCAKLGEAETMAAGGISNILIANQVVGVEKMRRLMDLLAIADVTVAVESESNIIELNEAARYRNKVVHVLIEIDVGMHRCGVSSAKEAIILARKIEALKNVSLSGIMGYEGHVIFTFEKEERARLATACMDELISAKHELEKAGFPIKIVSGGGTGTYDISSKVKGVTEIQAGSYLTMDRTYTYLNLGFQEALTLYTTIIAVKDGHLILDAGMKAVSSEFGMPVPLGIEGASISSLSEEHGHLTLAGTGGLKVGQKIELVPTHGCTTINLHDRFYAVRNDIVEGVWDISARGRFT